MASRGEFFSKDVPSPIASFDWNSLYHRASLVSHLVKGVYQLERKRVLKLCGSASPWWECYSFTLKKRLIDGSNDSIYGAVFENANNYQNTPNSIVPPRYVIALRGTTIPETTLRYFDDVKHDIRIAFENLHCGGRSKKAIEVIQSFVAEHGHTTVWIAGHSLGAGLALLAGKAMAMSGSPVEAFLFNPPISLIPLEYLVKSEKLKFAFRFTWDIFKAVVAKTLNLNEAQEGHLSWKPNLFVNQSDPVCSEFIGYFKHRGDMAGRGLGEITRLANGYSFRSFVFGGGENSSSDSSPKHLHFLPRAFMMVNKIESSCFLKSHALSQWRNPMLPRSTTCASYDD